MDHCDIHDAESSRAWDIFNRLCRRVLNSATRVLHKDATERLPADFDGSTPSSSFAGLVLSSAPDSIPESITSPNTELPIFLRREYVWRTIPNVGQSLGIVAAQIELDLEMSFPTLRKIALANTFNTHRCAGYIREEVTLASSLADSAVVTHDSPSPLEVCPICGQPVPTKFTDNGYVDHAPGTASSTGPSVRSSLAHHGAIRHDAEIESIPNSAGLSRVARHASSALQNGGVTEVISRRCFDCMKTCTNQWRQHPITGVILCNHCGQKAYKIMARERRKLNLSVGVVCQN
ncbi:hypothetical protein R3P38DRAFT_3476629 [Favolaschia claudopus]|uniref:GATA-type domain-containing protein n=1 Tax=Favolaschia claudopus TaxID=2862362 RepID=A0AAV9ZAY0_9AGAR